ncbi:MAG: cyclase [Ignavibacteria bacterium GWB2_35_6b]|nr:MAG: cyclase [Ignavibacteria bacterium GWB2_35_6b]
MFKRKLIDLSHTIEDGIITYKGLPAPIICDYLSREKSKSHYAEGTTFHIGKIEMVANTGTYLDSPFHRYENGKDISELELNAVADLEGILFHADKNKRAVEKELFLNHDLKNKAVLVHTGWDKHWKTDQYFEGHNFLTEEAAVYLKENGVKLVGIDSLNIDDTSTGTRPVHSTLLGADVLIVEHMCNLDKIPASSFRFFAVPVKVKGMGTFPVRAFGVI